MIIDAMINIFMVALMMVFIPSISHAQQETPSAQASVPQINARICIIDKTKAADGQVFQPCDAPAQNNALLAKGFTIARIDRATIKSKQPIWAHGLCRYVDNRSPTQDVLVPFGTQEEWETFNRFVPGIMKVAGCCVPRALTLRDIPEPASPCIGSWVLQQVVSANSATQPGPNGDMILDEKMKPGGGGALVSNAGAALEAPIARDDDNTAFTVDGVREFAARWSCENEEGVAPAVPNTDADAPPASHGDVLYVSFTLNCIREQWTPVALQNFCVPSEANHAYGCEVAGYPPGTPGDVIMYEKTLCPKGSTVRTLIKDSCVGDKVAPPSIAAQPTLDEPPSLNPSVNPSVPQQEPQAATPELKPSDTARKEKSQVEKPTPR